MYRCVQSKTVLTKHVFNNVPDIQNVQSEQTTKKSDTKSTVKKGQTMEQS